MKLRACNKQLIIAILYDIQIIKEMNMKEMIGMNKEKITQTDLKRTLDLKANNYLDVQFIEKFKK